jgi:PadR family transcriptional regulator PadR
MRRELLRSHLDLLTLAVLDGGPTHGYGLIRDLERRSSGTFNLPEGTVYPILHRLTLAGRSALTPSTAEWRQLAGAIDAVLQGA